MVTVATSPHVCSGGNSVDGLASAVSVVGDGDDLAGASAKPERGLSHDEGHDDRQCHQRRAEHVHNQRLDEHLVLVLWAQATQPGERGAPVEPAVEGVRDPFRVRDAAGDDAKERRRRGRRRRQHVQK